VNLMLFRKGAFGLALAAGLAAIVSVTGRDAFAANAAVTINNFAFSPASVTVNVGDTVTFTNAEAGIPHTASSDTAGGFDSGTLSTGQSFTTSAFTSAGTFTYHCNIHPGMQGTVIVAGAQAATATPAPATATAAPPSATAAAPTATATTAAATQTAATPTAAGTALATPTSASSAASPTAGSGTAASASPSATPGAPATGEDDDDGGSNSTAMVLLGLGALAAVAGIGGWALMRRRNAV